jgi:hypothetical protein
MAKVFLLNKKKFQLICPFWNKLPQSGFSSTASQTTCGVLLFAD